MEYAHASSANYDFRRHFDTISRPGVVRYLRECGYDPNEPPDGLDDCWFTAQEYVCGLWRYLKSHQGLAEMGEPWDAQDAETTAGVYESDLILTRKESGLKEMECGEPDIALLHKMGLGFRFRPQTIPGPNWYFKLTETQSARFAAVGERWEAEQQVAGSSEGQQQAKHEGAPDPKPDVKSIECLFQRIGCLDAKPRDYLIRGFIARNEVGNPFGRPDSFKGVTAAQLVVHIAGGVDFLGLEVKQAPTAYFAAERGEQVKRRIKGHIQRLGLPSDLPCYYGGRPIDLLCRADLDFLIASIKAIVRDAGKALGFLVIDTQSRTMGGDENSTRDGAAYAKAIEEIRQATDATLWIIAHSGHSEEAQDRPRGSSALLGAYDTFYRHKKTDERSGEIKITIDRDGLGGKEFPFTVEIYDTGAVNDDGEPVMVPYLESAASTVKFTFKKGDEPSKTESPTRAESEALRGLHKAMKKHGEVTPKGEGIPAGEVTVCEREWREAYYELYRTREQSTLRQGFSRSTNSLIAKKLVNEYGARRWPAGL